MAWITPIYDRTLEDVEYVKKLNEKYRLGTIEPEEETIWQSGLKGALNVSDLTRVTTNIQHIADELGVTISNMSISQPMYIQQYQTIIQNIITLKREYMVKSTSPEIPDLPLNTYQKWNDIEKVLADIQEVYEINSEGRYFTNDNFYSNNNFLI